MLMPPFARRLEGGSYTKLCAKHDSASIFTSICSDIFDENGPKQLMSVKKLNKCTTWKETIFLEEIKTSWWETWLSARLKHFTHACPRQHTAFLKTFHSQKKERKGNALVVTCMWNSRSMALWNHLWWLGGKRSSFESGWPGFEPWVWLNVFLKHPCNQPIKLKRK